MIEEKQSKQNDWIFLLYTVIYIHTYTKHFYKSQNSTVLPVSPESFSVYSIYFFFNFQNTLMCYEMFCLATVNEK